MQKPDIPLYASVVLEQSIAKALDYEIPSTLQDLIQIGSFVEVPIRGRAARGFVIHIKDTKEVARTFAIKKALTDGPIINTELLNLALFIAKYYDTPLGKVIKTMLPSGVRKNTKAKEQYFVIREKSKEEMRLEIPKLINKSYKQAQILEALLPVRKGMLLTKLLEITKATAPHVHALVKKGFLSLKKVDPDLDLLEDEEYLLTKPKKLQNDQKEAIDTINHSIQSNRFKTHLLYGVTGSGKTEIYLQAIETAISQQRGVVMLVPEIALTQQTIERFKSRFHEKIAILHHRISDGKRKEAWDKIKDGSISIVIGARSAIFSPIQNLGLIIVDEEHEPSYKQQDESPTYHARDIAVVRGKNNHATVILGSATPSLESYYNAAQGKYILNKLSCRHNNATLPTVEIIDMKREFDKAKRVTLFSDKLLAELQKCQKNGEQAILFLNRRGYHTNLQCLSCGESVKCPHCDTSLTFHKQEARLACHLCGYEMKPSASCPSCNAHAMMKFSGMGTEKVEVALRAILPDIRTIRIDRDSTKHKGSLEMLLKDFRTGKADVLIGTQMVAKGLHFPDVTLVGVLNCDTQLHLPDFRSQENIFQLITQVSGRAGRGELAGKVLLQTQLPEHETLLFAKNHDFEGFYKEEIEVRRHFFFPPFSRIVKIIFTANSEKKAQLQAEQYHAAVQQVIPEALTLHPVTPSGHPKVKDSYRFQFLIRGKSCPEILAVLHRAEQSLATTITRFIDVDPTTTFF